MRIISGTKRGKKLKEPDNYDIRPTTDMVKESMFNIVQFDIEGRRVLDLFAGSGSLAFEALSRGAPEAVFVEKDPKAAACLARNAAALDAESRCRILAEDVLRITARRPAAPFQVIFIDPPYGESLFSPTLKNILRQNWLAENGFLIAEVEKGLRLNAEKQPGLSLISDDLYGQTRVILWTSSHDQE